MGTLPALDQIIDAAIIIIVIVWVGLGNHNLLGTEIRGPSNINMEKRPVTYAVYLYHKDAAQTREMDQGHHMV